MESLPKVDKSITFHYCTVICDVLQPIDVIFTRESSYCFERISAIAILSVRPSHGWISQKRYKLRNLYLQLPGRL